MKIVSRNFGYFLYGRLVVGYDRVPPTWKQDEQDAGDHEGPPRLTSAALAPTDVDRGVDKTHLLQYNYLKFEIINWT